MMTLKAWIRKTLVNVADYDAGTIGRFHWLIKTVVPIVKDKKHIYILDAGCGKRATIAVKLARRVPNAKILAIDSNEHVIVNIKKKVLFKPKNVFFRKASLSDILEKNIFDIIYCLDVLEHIKDDLKVLEGLHSNLVPGGYLIVHVPLCKRKSYLEKWSGPIDVWPDDHVRDGYHDSELRKKMGKVGLKILWTKNTYGKFGGLAYELWLIFYHYAGRGKVLLQSLLRPLIEGFLWFDPFVVTKEGRGLLILAEKPKNK